MRKRRVRTQRSGLPAFSDVYLGAVGRLCMRLAASSHQTWTRKASMWSIVFAQSPAVRLYRVFLLVRILILKDANGAWEDAHLGHYLPHTHGYPSIFRPQCSHKNWMLAILVLKRQRQENPGALVSRFNQPSKLQVSEKFCLTQNKESGNWGGHGHWPLASKGGLYKPFTVFWSFTL